MTHLTVCIFLSHRDDDDDDFMTWGQRWQPGNRNNHVIERICSKNLHRGDNIWEVFVCFFLLKMLFESFFDYIFGVKYFLTNFI